MTKGKDAMSFTIIPYLEAWAIIDPESNDPWGKVLVYGSEADCRAWLTAYFKAKFA